MNSEKVILALEDAVQKIVEKVTPLNIAFLLSTAKQAVEAFKPRPQPSKTPPDMSADELRSELKSLVVGTLSFGDFNPTVCQRVCALFAALDEKCRKKEYPRAYTNA